MVNKHLIVATALWALSQPGLAQTIRAELDGRPMQFQQPPVMVGGSVLVPLRGIFEGLGADVHYEGATQTIRATRGEKVVQLTLGSSTATVDGRPVHLDSPARTVGDTTMVPLRFVSEALGAHVRWIAASSTVVIESPAPPSVTYQAPEPVPPVRQAQPPTITSLIHNARGPLRVGERLVVSMTGDPGGQASFEILGCTGPVPMREVTPGAYEGEVFISPEMRVRAGTLVAHLSENGQEAAKEASRPVTVGEREEFRAGPRPNREAFEVHPLPGSVEDNPRDALRVRLEGEVAPQSARLLLDGIDVTPISQWRGNEIVFQPVVDLVPGTHQAQFEAVDWTGRPLNQQWSFTVRPGYPQPTYQPGEMTLTVTNLQPGSYVPPVFEVQGQTQPHATVSVNVVSGQPLNASGKADAAGHFNVPVDASWLPRNAPLTLQIQASTREGWVSSTQTLAVVLR